MGSCTNRCSGGGGVGAVEAAWGGDLGAARSSCPHQCDSQLVPHLADHPAAQHLDHLVAVIVLLRRCVVAR
eukprot:scaffold4043_cov90-Isochrysis_galbana.AAC.2